ncbi:MAG: TetR/AcrR family transcriptional regulator [Solibacillus sp.]|uniref:TetR/AcrR family transcriptional regulator n=1 Tax=unclassified Solibacillus TaxID=2637870 RepID=UPI0030F9721A
MNQRKRKVIEVAQQLFIEKGFHNTSIQDILEKALISKGTFYNYFSSKNECFIAIMEQTRYIASLRRHELMLGQDPGNEEILIEQIKVLMQVYKEQNLFSIFEGIFHSNDKELRDLLTRYRLIEIEWVANRFIDVFGEETRPHAFEISICFFGMVQHLSMASRMIYGTSSDTDKIVFVAYRNIKAIIPIMLESPDILIAQGAIQLLDSSHSIQNISKEMIIEKLHGFYEELQYDKVYAIGCELTECLLDEFNRDQLRLSVIKSLLKPFHEALVDTSHEAECIELANLMWYYIKLLHNKQ